MHIFFVEIWAELDLNQCRQSQRIYSPSPLTTRTSTPFFCYSKYNKFYYQVISFLYFVIKNRWRKMELFVYYQVIFLHLFNNTPRGIRIPVASVKGRCPRPLDDGGFFFFPLRKIEYYLFYILSIVYSNCILNNKNNNKI